MPLWASILLILLLFVILVRSADYAIIAVRKLAQATSVRTFTISIILVSLSTSLPELFVGINSAYSGIPILSLGNVLGSNIANVSLVLGIAVFFSGVAYIKSSPRLTREFFISLLAGILPLLLLWDRGLSRLDGVILIAFYIAFAGGFFHGRLFGGGTSLGHEREFWQGIWQGIKNSIDARKDLVKFLVAVAAILASSYFLVALTKSLTFTLGIPLFLLGLFLVSIGTVLPETALAYRSIKDNTPDLLVGNRLGTIVANATLVLGLVAVISPFQISHRREYLLAVIAFVATFVLFWFFARTRHRIGRLEAGILLAVYVIFVVLEFSGFRLF